MNDVQWIQYFGLGSSLSCDFLKKEIKLLTNYYLPSCSLRCCQQDLVFLHNASEDWNLRPIYIQCLWVTLLTLCLWIICHLSIFLLLEKPKGKSPISNLFFSMPRIFNFFFLFRFAQGECKAVRGWTSLVCFYPFGLGIVPLLQTLFFRIVTFIWGKNLLILWYEKPETSST